jgi:hypothetical protein
VVRCVCCVYGYMMDGWIESRSWEFGAGVVSLWMGSGMVWVSGIRRFMGGIYIGIGIFWDSLKWVGGSLVSSQYTLAPTAINFRLVLALIAVVLEPFFQLPTQPPARIVRHPMHIQRERLSPSTLDIVDGV